MAIKTPVRCVLHSTPSFLLSVLIPTLPSSTYPNAIPLQCHLSSLTFIKLCSFTHTPSPHFASPSFLTKVHFIDQHLSMHPPSRIHDGFSHVLPGTLNPQSCKCCSEHPQDGKWYPEHLFSKKSVKFILSNQQHNPLGDLWVPFTIWSPTNLSTKTGWITNLPSSQWNYQGLRPYLLSNHQRRRVLP